MKTASFPYRWKLSDIPPPTGPTVFSCFCGGGGSSMGYKLAGLNCLGGVDIDPKMCDVYEENLKPKYLFECGVGDLITAKLPKRLHNLDVLDGSPPCSSFSMSGSREEYWGKEKVFREGQKKQVLDRLFFDFIALGKRLQPRIIVAENVEGMLLGNAVKYVTEIHRGFSDAGYTSAHYLIDSSTLGLPQARRRIFFIAVRNDLLHMVRTRQTLFGGKHLAFYPEFNVPKIYLKDVLKDKDYPRLRLTEFMHEHWSTMVARKIYGSISRVHPDGNCFSIKRVNPREVCGTMCASGNTLLHPDYPRYLSRGELMSISGWPTDYNFLDMKPIYVMGMSVPPLMTANVIHEFMKQNPRVFA